MHPTAVLLWHLTEDHNINYSVMLFGFVKSSIIQPHAHEMGA